MENKLIICKNCGDLFTGNFCNQCGEKDYKEQDKTVNHFINEAFHFITHFDGKFLSTFRLIFLKPGLLAIDYCSGIRKKYFSPLSMFLMGVVIYLLAPAFTGLNVPLQQHKQEVYYPVVKPLIKQKLANKKITFEQLAEKYDHKSPAFAKVLLLIIIPLSALSISLLFFRDKKHFFDNLVIAAELNTFFLYFEFLLLPLLIFVTRQLINKFFGETFFIDDSILMVIHFVVFGLVSSIAFRKFYKSKWQSAIFKSILFLILHAFIVIIVYRLILAILVLLFL